MGFAFWKLIDSRKPHTLSRSRAQGERQSQSGGIHLEPDDGGRALGAAEGKDEIDEQI